MLYLTLFTKSVNMKVLYLKWKRKQLLLKIDKLTLQLWHSPDLSNQVNELELQVRSIDNYLG